MNFKEYFYYQESMTLYHGTQSNFSTLEPRKARYGTGISFTTNPNIAKNYAQGKYKGGKTDGVPIIKHAEYSGNSFNLFDPVPKNTINEIHNKLSPYTLEFTKNKNAMFTKNLYGAWSKNGETFYKEVQRSFAKRGTDAECKLAKSRNKGLEICKPCSIFSQMPDFLNNILVDLGFDSLCYDDTNDGTPHRCYFLVTKKKLKELN